MNCHARTNLLNELSRALAAYSAAVNRINHDESFSFELAREVRKTRDEYSACRLLLVKHESEHGCSMVLVEA
jgi:hypothetical protein